MGDLNTKRIVLLGKTGAGKSSLANTMLGEKIFTVGHTCSSKTKTCKAKTGSVNGRKVTVVDTPGFFDTDIPEKELKREIVRCITECSPGPHAFLIVLKIERFTELEMAVIAKICKYFSEEIYKYATVVFTHGDQLPEEMNIENFVIANKFLSDLVKKCGGRCHVIDSKYWNQTPGNKYRSNRFQVEELLKTIDKTVKGNKGGCYTNEMLQAVEEEIKWEEEIIRQSSGNMSNEEIRQQAKSNFFDRLLIRLTGVTTGVLLGAFCGVAAMVGVVCAFVKITPQLAKAIKLTTGISLGAAEATASGGAAASGGAGAIGSTILVKATVIAAVAGAAIGGHTGYNAAEGAETPLEAAKLTAIDIKETAMNAWESVNDLIRSFTKAKSQ